MTEETEQEMKPAYATPELKIYGSMVELTAAGSGPQNEDPVSGKIRRMKKA